MSKRLIAFFRIISLHLIILSISLMFTEKVAYSICFNVNDKLSLTDSPKVLLNVPLISQCPELINGCEVTCLAMLLNYMGIKATKLELANDVIKDTTPLIRSLNGAILYWGNPKVGFVGDITGKKSIGYSIYPDGLKPLIDDYTEGNGKILNGEDYFIIEQHLNSKKPVLVWVTSDFRAPRRHAKWENNGQTIDAYFSQHCVLVTGYSNDYVYYNDPLNLGKNKKVHKSTFISIYNAMGRMALTYE